MTGPRRVVGALSIASMIVLGSVGAPLVASNAASARPALACGPYSSDTCTLGFSQGVFPPGGFPGFYVPPGFFNPNELISGYWFGPIPHSQFRGGVGSRQVHRSFTVRAGHKGGVKGTFHLPKHLKKGSYTLKLTGKRSHRHVVGHFRVS